MNPEQLPFEIGIPIAVILWVIYMGVVLIRYRKHKKECN